LERILQIIMDQQIAVFLYEYIIYGTHRVYTLYRVSSGLIIALKYIIYYALVFEIVIVGDKLPYLDRNELYYIYAQH